MVHIEPSRLVHHFEGRCQSGNQSLERWSSHSEVVSTRARNRLEEVKTSRVPWNDRVLSQRKIGSKTIAKKKPLAGQHCLTLLAMRNCPRVVPANSTCVVLS